MLLCQWARIPQAENLHFDLHTRSFFPMKCASDVSYNSSVLGRWSFSNHWHKLFSVLSRLSLCFFRGSREHSQMVATLYPLSSARSMFLLSRSVLSFSFFAHLLSASPRTLAAFLQPGCWCQKQPWTYTATLRPSKTRSGEPIARLPCRRYRKPRENSSFRTIISGAVSFLRIRDMFHERSAALLMSAIVLAPGHF